MKVMRGGGKTAGVPQRPGADRAAGSPPSCMGSCRAWRLWFGLGVIATRDSPGRSDVDGAHVRV
eukprot:2372170-Pyramimonas_sp.AAC.1